MAIEHAEDLTRSTGVMTAQDFAALEDQWIPSAGAYFSAQMEQAFDRTTGVRAYEAVSTWGRELAAQGDGGLAV